ncbi:MAG TPA: AAA family ATPase [Kofleriaceae bacterium]|nr:AAA family ATPase [Kofleriaceae bacterium]
MADHLRLELERIDLLVRIQVLRARQVAGDDAFRGLAISDDDVDAIFLRPLGAPHWAAARDDAASPALEHELARRTAEVVQRRAKARRNGAPSRLLALARDFELDDLDLDLVCLALAPEFDSRYDRLFGYLHDNVTRKRPTVDVALGLFCASFEQRLAARARFLPAARLMRHRLIELFAEAGDAHPTLLGTGYQVPARIVAWLLGDDAFDPRLDGHARLAAPAAGRARRPLPEPLTALVERQRAAGHVHEGVYLQGPPGTGKSTTAEAVAAALARPLVVLDGASLDALADEAAETVAQLAFREARLLGAIVLWRGFDDSLRHDGRPRRPGLVTALDDHRGLVVLAGHSHWEPPPHAGRRWLRVELLAPTAEQRARLWADALGVAHDGHGDELLAFAARYRYTAAQIRHAGALARALAEARASHHAHGAGPHAAQVTEADLAEACRQTVPPRATAARRLSPTSTWDDLVVPTSQLERLREICDHARYRERVFGAWGFDRKLATGKGLNLLFSGPPGTGKTMTAGIMAHELRLELFQIDLAAIVSKYIGETEKQLGRVFDEAEGSGAVLFFDEADALFGKRSEVRDSHDRYANIETSYLLQRIDAYEGMVILTTNFSRNLDDAFVRRFQFIVEFAAPAEPERRRIWESIWPREVPRANDLDLDLMAKRFELSGGHIRNIAVAAAILAAAQGGPVAQRHLLHATKREYQKLGRRIDEALFRNSTK